MSKARNLAIVLALILLSAAMLLLFERPMPVTGSTVLVTVDGEAYGRYTLGEKRELLIQLDDGEFNRILMDAEGVEMIEATCRDQKCIHQGKVTAKNAASRALGNQIICLPHRLIITLTDLPTDEPDPDLPDV